MRIIILYKEYSIEKEWRVSQETYLMVGPLGRLMKAWDGDFIAEDESSWKDSSFPRAQYEWCWNIICLLWILKAPCKLMIHGELHEETLDRTPFEWCQEHFPKP